MTSPSSFDDLLAEGQAVPVDGWDFSWFDGRATEQHTSWGYSELLADRLSAADSSLDVQTGGGEVYARALARATREPDHVAATESWPPNVAVARRNLARFGAEIVHVAEDQELPLAALHQRIRRDGRFVAHSQRYLIEARRTCAACRWRTSTPRGLTRPGGP